MRTAEQWQKHWRVNGCNYIQIADEDIRRIQADAIHYCTERFARKKALTALQELQAEADKLEAQ
jgi:hypothetical protein